MVDFAQLHRVMADRRSRLSGTASAADIERELRQRATDMASRVSQLEAATPFAEVVVATRGTVVFGLPIDRVVEVRMVELTALPHATAVVNALFQVRGRVHCLVDALPFYGVEEPLGHGVTTLVALIRGRRGVVGLRLDELVGARLVTVDEIEDGVHGDGVAFVRAVTRDLVEILDVDLLLDQPSLLISSGR
jgi:chemotaxis signal transduction protein